MNHRFACLMAAGLALSSGSGAVMSASPVDHSPGNVDILVDGAPQPRYPHDGRWYIEAQEPEGYWHPWVEKSLGDVIEITLEYAMHIATLTGAVSSRPRPATAA